MSIRYVVGDLLETDAQYIAHQCNCVVSGAASGIAGLIFEKYPYSNCYDKRLVQSEFGTIQICGDASLNMRFVINMFSQYYPGRPKFRQFRHVDNDSFSLRKEKFNNCLSLIKQIPDLHTIAFPYKIGCGLAGGNWKDYEEMLILSFDNCDIDAQIIMLKEQH